MGFTTRFDGTLRFVRTHWPTFILGYGGGLATLIIFIWISASRGWLSFVYLALAAGLILLYFLVANLWAAHKLFDGTEIADRYISLGELKADEKIILPDLGKRTLGIELAQRLSGGLVTIIDIYNPQLAPSRALSREAQETMHIEEDPRIVWKSGSIDLLPLPDQGVSTVVLHMTASELWQEGDRICLFNEILRILTPGGHLLLAERVRSTTNWLVMGPAALQLKKAAYWRDRLSLVGFRVERELVYGDLLHFFLMEKPEPAES